MLIPGVVTAALVLAIVGAAGASSAAAPPPLHEVRLVAASDDQNPFAFEPAALTVPVGTTVRWVNTLDVFHTVTFSDAADQRVTNGTFDRSLASQGDTTERVFDTPGAYTYFCQPHSTFMAATITVTPQPDNQSRGSSRLPLLIGIPVAMVGTGALGARLRQRRRRRRLLGRHDRPPG